jgi:PiT family inorganic phosphate transporter
VTTGGTVAIGMALAFAFTNGFHDAANAIATLVATRAARPGPAVAMAAVFNVLGPLLLGKAVADTIAGIVALPADDTVRVIGAGLTGAVVWNVVTWWRGLPSSSSHALVGGIVGAALVTHGADAVNWGGLGDGLRPSGVLGVLAALALSPLIGLAAAIVIERASIRGLRRLTTRAAPPVRIAQWPTSAWLALSHGANDAQKSVGVVGALLVAEGQIGGVPAVPVWAVLASAAALTAGTALGGWRIVRTIGRRIFPLRPLDGLVSQASSAGVILAASIGGAPVSTTHVVASSVVGVGLGRRRAHHVGWRIAREMSLAWLTTIPAAAAVAVASLPAWRWLT